MDTKRSYVRAITDPLNSAQNFASLFAQRRTDSTSTNENYSGIGAIVHTADGNTSYSSSLKLEADGKWHVYGDLVVHGTVTEV
jgi:hypothetical protein